MIEVEAPDGSIIEFPEGTDDATIDRVMRESFAPGKSRSAILMDQAVAAPTEAEYRRLMAEANAAAVQDGETPEGVVYDPRTGGLTDVTLRPDQGALMAAAQGAGQGVSFGGMDEAVGALYGLMGPGSYSQNRDYALASMRADLDAARRDHALSAYGAEVLGAVALPVGAAGGGGSLLSRMATSGGLGAAQGAAYGFGSAEGGFDARKDAAARSAAIGGALGAAAPLVGAGIRKGVERAGEGRAVRAAAKAAPSLDDLRAHANALYAQADQVTNLPRTDLAARMPATLDEALRGGMDDVLTPGAARVASQMDEMANAASPTLSFRDLDIMRKRAGIPAGNTSNKTEQGVAMRLIDALDDYMDEVDPSLSGVAGEARETWGRMSRAQKVADALAAGDTYVSGAASGTRNQIGSLLRNPKRSRGYSDVEKAALKRIANPGVLENLVHYAGGGIGQIASGVTGAALGGATGPVGSAAGAAVGAAAGAAARKLSEAITTRKADQAMRIIASGAKASVPALTPSQQALIEALYLGAIRPTAASLAEALR